MDEADSGGVLVESAIPLISEGNILIEGGGKGEKPLSTSDLFSETIPPNEELHNYYMVYLNGTLVGVVPKGSAPTQFVEMIRTERTKSLSPFTGVSIDHYTRSIYINTDAGRLMIPLIPAKFILDSKHREEFQIALTKVNALLKSPETETQAWDFMVANGFVELYDHVMVDNTTIAHSIGDLLSRPTECKHVQLPCEHCGIIMCLVCSADMNKGARNIYICNHWKQGIGATIWNQFTNYLPEVNLMQGPQRPLVRSAFNEILGMDRYPFCQNVHVAMMALAENQLDAIMGNQGAFDRGVLKVLHITFQSIKPDSASAAFGVPDFSKVYSPIAPLEAYQKVDPVLGTPKILGQEFKYGDVIAAITKPLSAADIEGLKGTKFGGKEVVYTLSDASILHTYDHCPNERHPTYARLTAAFSSVAQDERTRLIQLATSRFAKAGDKLASEHAQKSILGYVLEEWETPYNEDGIRPVLMFNPPSAVKRETPGQIDFLLYGKICALYGTSLECTPFMNNVHPELLSGLLEELGMDPKGTETMFDPMTGIAYSNPIDFGILAYMRMRRMVDDLLQCREGKGPREFFSRMPVKGRVRKGGVMYDEMTRNATLASGATLITRDSMFTQAAPSENLICDKCHQYAYPSPMTRGLSKCDRCGNLDPAISRTAWIPYNAPLLYSILAGAGCVLEVLTDASCTLADQIPEEEASPMPKVESVAVPAVEEEKKEKKEKKLEKKEKKR